MILITVGTHYQSFERLVKAGDEYASTTKEKVIIQRGYTEYECKYAECFDFCQKDRMSQLLKEADVLVMQGGWGALRESIDMGKRIVAVPRIEGVEHVHDQEQVVRKLESEGCILAVYDIKDLPEKIEAAKTYAFKPLKHGSPDIIRLTLEEWFPEKK